ncbi:MAG: hypothetical protein MZV64_26100 [Ignavibacteriales bacterium]|nr:hypothetical protein [Ignavibacteriales bacterium]
MSNLTVAVLAPPDYAKDLGKKGTTSDITFYNLKKGMQLSPLLSRHAIRKNYPRCFIPYPLRIVSFWLWMKSMHTFGECVLMLQCAGKSNGYLILKNYISTDQIAPLIKGTVLEHYEVIEEDMVGLREKIARYFGKTDRPPENT